MVIEQLDVFGFHNRQDIRFYRIVYCFSSLTNFFHWYWDVTIGGVRIKT